MDFTQILLVAFLVESLIQTIKPIYDRKKGWNKDALIALFVGVGLCALVKVNLFSFLNLPVLIGDATISQYVGIFLTGLITSRGANLAHDVLMFVQNSSNSVGNSTNAVG
jgi:hypothetical protein